jgi:hypothetical protein
VEGCVLRIDQICERQNLCTFVLATLIALIAWAMPITPAFADLSPEFSSTTASAEVSPPIQLAQADLPPGVGSLNDYMSQSGDGPSTSPVPPQGYSPQPIPPQNYYPQGVPSQEWNNRYVDPNTQRSALIGAAVVGALAVGLWAWQQHELQQSRRYVPARRRHNRRPAFDN